MSMSSTLEINSDASTINWRRWRGATLRLGPLTDSVALVTGGGRGIGQLVARALADAGAAVGVVARSPDELDRTVGLIESAGGTAAAAVADVADECDVGRAIAELRDRLGPVDLLVNNAGITGPIGPLWKVDADAWWNTVDVNLRGILLASQLVLPEMVERRRGRIINMGSQAGAHRWPLVSAYSVSKAAVTKLSENLAHETARYGVGVFSVHPGLLPIGMSTEVIHHTPTNSYEAHVRDWTLNELDEGRGATPKQATELIMRIATGDADRLSGRHISVHDDLDALIERADEVRSRDLYVLRPARLGLSATTSTAGPTTNHITPTEPRRFTMKSKRSTRPAAAPAYYLGRPFATWQAAIQRPRS